MFSTRDPHTAPHVPWRVVVGGGPGLVGDGFIEIAILGNDLQLKGNWTGVRDVESKDRTGCQWCRELWSDEVQPRVDYALGCGNCDIAGRKVDARGEASIWQLSDEKWALFLQHSEEARVRRAARLKAKAEKAEQSEGQARKRRKSA